MQSQKRNSLSLLAAVAPALAIASGCAERRPARPAVTIRLATTTSTENSGLLGALLPEFTRKTGIGVDVIAVGTGRALRLAENGDVDAVLVHAREAEIRFVKRGGGVNRRGVMRNDFVIVGPPGDPAGVRGGRDAPWALFRIAAAKGPFVSRGDGSGTHLKETSLWKAAGLEPEGSWYVSAGQGMGAVLVMAYEKRAYTLADRGTFVAFREKIDLDVLVEGDARLDNPYSIIAVNPARHPHARYAEAMALIAWITSPEGQERIREFTTAGARPFHPSAVPRVGKVIER